MTVRSTPRVPSRSKSPRPAVDTLLQKPLSDWFAEWKARKALTLAPSRAHAQEPAATVPTSSWMPAHRQPRPKDVGEKQGYEWESRQRSAARRECG